jgi:hypothetical protein
LSAARNAKVQSYGLAIKAFVSEKTPSASVFSCGWFVTHFAGFDSNLRFRSFYSEPAPADSAVAVENAGLLFHSWSQLIQQLTLNQKARCAFF